MGLKYALKKGHNWERFIAKELSRILNNNYRRVPMSGAIHYAFEGDIMKLGNKPSIIDNHIIECKDCKTILMPQWIKQTEEESVRADVKKWLIFFKHNGKGFVVQPLNQYSNLIAKLNEKI